MPFTYNLGLTLPGAPAAMPPALDSPYDPADPYGYYPMADPVAAAPVPAGKKKKKYGAPDVKTALRSAASLGDMDITQGMQPVRPFSLTGGLLGGMR